jgi:mono/diheme cytochrome c family protein
MTHRYLIHGAAVILIALAALVIIRVHGARGATRNDQALADGRHLAEAWCTTCHAIDSKAAGTANTAPDFAAIANQPSTTELSLKVFLRSSHQNMPNLLLKPEQADNLVAYILSLKRN